MTTTVKRTTLRDLVVKADPEWARTSRRVTQYKFSNGRTFEADYQSVGIYGEGLTSLDIDNPGATPVPT